MHATYHELLLANLRGAIRPGARGYLSKRRARELLIALVGQDLGAEPEAWEAWLSANPHLLREPGLRRSDS